MFDGSAAVVPTGPLPPNLNVAGFVSRLYTDFLGRSAQAVAVLFLDGGIQRENVDRALSGVGDHFLSL